MNVVEVEIKIEKHGEKLQNIIKAVVEAKIIKMIMSIKIGKNKNMMIKVSHKKIQSNIGIKLELD